MVFRSPEQEPQQSSEQGDQAPPHGRSARLRRAGSIAGLVTAGVVSAILPNTLGAAPIAPASAHAPAPPEAASQPHLIEQLFPPESRTEGQKYVLSIPRNRIIDAVAGRFSYDVLQDAAEHPQRTIFYDGNADGRGTLEEVIHKGNRTYRFDVKVVKFEDTFVPDTTDRVVSAGASWLLSDRPGDVHTEGADYERWHYYYADNPWYVGSGMSEPNKGGGNDSDVMAAVDPNQTSAVLQAAEADAAAEFQKLAAEAGII